MLYGWIEVGASNNNVFTNTNNEDIIVRTIKDNNKIILGNSLSNAASPITAAVYIRGNNVGINKVPDSNVMLDVNGLTVLHTCHVGLSNTSTSLTLNGTFWIQDVASTYAPAYAITHSNNVLSIGYSNIQRLQITNGVGLTLNDNVTITKDVFSTGFNLVSDERTKKDIHTSDAVCDVATLENLRVRNFTRRSTSAPIKGFIAQEVEKTFPQAVVSCPSSNMKTVDIAQIVALNTSVLQFILRKIEHLENYVAENK